jgi:hypothetical protein
MNCTNYRNIYHLRLLEAGFVRFGEDGTIVAISISDDDAAPHPKFGSSPLYYL